MYFNYVFSRLKQTSTHSFRLDSNALHEKVVLICFLWKRLKNKLFRAFSRWSDMLNVSLFFSVSLIRLLDQKRQHFNVDIWIKMQYNRIHVHFNSSQEKDKRANKSIWCARIVYPNEWKKNTHKHHHKFNKTWGKWWEYNYYQNGKNVIYQWADKCKRLDVAFSCYNLI